VRRSTSRKSWATEGSGEFDVDTSNDQPLYEMVADEAACSYNEDLVMCPLNRKEPRVPSFNRRFRLIVSGSSHSLQRTGQRRR
jgi:hypothetical protein